MARERVLRVPFEALDVYAAPEFARWTDAALASTAGEGPVHLVLDLQDVELVMAAGVEALQRLERRIVDDGGTLHLVAAAPIVVRVLEICGVGARWGAMRPLQSPDRG
ncbi:MAG: STAS domain-containing protein [Acidimicrobiia bacterium]